MKLTAERVLAALPVIDKIIAEKRPLTIKGAYRMSRMLQKLLPEFRLLEQRRDTLIESFDFKAVPDGAGPDAQPVPTVPADKVHEFLTAWNEVLKDEIELELEPIPLAYLGPADAESPVSAAEMLQLGELLVDDSDCARDLPKAA